MQGDGGNEQAVPKFKLMQRPRGGLDPSQVVGGKLPPLRSERIASGELVEKEDSVETANTTEKERYEFEGARHWNEHTAKDDISHWPVDYKPRGVLNRPRSSGDGENKGKKGKRERKKSGKGGDAVGSGSDDNNTTQTESNNKIEAVNDNVTSSSNPQTIPNPNPEATIATATTTSATAAATTTSATTNNNSGGADNGQQPIRLTPSQVQLLQTQTQKMLLEKQRIQQILLQQNQLHQAQLYQQQQRLAATQGLQQPPQAVQEGMYYQAAPYQVYQTAQGQTYATPVDQTAFAVSSPQQQPMFVYQQPYVPQMATGMPQQMIYSQVGAVQARPPPQMAPTAALSPDRRVFSMGATQYQLKSQSGVSHDASSSAVFSSAPRSNGGASHSQPSSSSSHPSAPQPRTILNANAASFGPTHSSTAPSSSQAERPRKPPMKSRGGPTSM